MCPGTLYLGYQPSPITCLVTMATKHVDGENFGNSKRNHIWSPSL